MTIVTKSSCKRELAWCGSMHGVIRTNIYLNHNNYPDSGRQHVNTTYRSWTIKTWTNTSKDNIMANILASRGRWRALPHVRLSCAKGIHKICVSTEFSLGLLPWTRFFPWNEILKRIFNALQQDQVSAKMHTQKLSKHTCLQVCILQLFQRVLAKFLMYASTYIYIYIYMRVHNRILNVVATGNIIQQAQTHLWPP